MINIDKPMQICDDRGKSHPVAIDRIVHTHCFVDSELHLALLHNGEIILFDKEGKVLTSNYEFFYVENVKSVKHSVLPGPASLPPHKWLTVSIDGRVSISDEEKTRRQ